MARLDLFRRFRFGRSTWKLIATVPAADEIPATIAHNAAVLVGPRRHPKWIAFDCPCWTGHRIVIPLDRGHYPHWRLSRLGGLTIRPSIDALGPAGRCHFLLWHGRIIWVHRGTEQ